jgi:hypothetical protein
MATFCPASTLSELDQMLDEPALGCHNRECIVADKNAHVLACACHRPGNDAPMLEDVHRAFHEQRDHLEVQDASRADLRRKGRDADVDKRIMQDTGIHMIVEDLADWVQFQHRLDLGHIHAAKIERGDIETSCPGMEVYRDVGVRPEEPVGQEPSVSADRRDTVLVPGPFPIHIDQIIASARIGPPRMGSEWPVDLSHHHRTPRRKHMGGKQPRRWCDVLDCSAGHPRVTKLIAPHTRAGVSRADRQ